MLAGNTALSHAELEPLWRDRLGREVSLAELWSIAAEITARYRNAGYILSRAIVPAQEIEDGRVRLEIVEGYIDNVIIDTGESGEVRGDRTLLDHAIERIKASRPLRASVLERYLLLLNDLPGVSARSILRPSPVEPGASELVIVWEEDRFAGSVSADNFGTRFLGPLEFTATGIVNNLYGRHDSTALRGLVTAQVEELQYVALRHVLPVGPEGTQLAFDGSYSNSEPAPLDGLQDVDQEGESLFASLYATHPFVRTRGRNLSVFGGFRFQNSDNDLVGTTVSRDRIRSITAGGTFDTVDPFRGVTLLGLDVTQGLNILGARGESDDDPPGSREVGSLNFTRFGAFLTRTQDLSRGFSLLTAVTGQYSLDSLLAPEQFGIGGETFGRGYGPYEIAGDHGLAGKLQLQYGSAVQKAWLESYQAYTFLDAGVVWQKDSDIDDDQDSLVSAGIGLDLNVRPDIAGTVIVAAPLTRDPETLNDPDERYPRVFFRLTKRF